MHNMGAWKLILEYIYTVAVVVVAVINNKYDLTFMESAGDIMSILSILIFFLGIKLCTAEEKTDFTRMRLNDMKYSMSYCISI